MKKVTKLKPKKKPKQDGPAWQRGSKHEHAFDLVLERLDEIKALLENKPEMPEAPPPLAA